MTAAPSYVRPLTHHDLDDTPDDGNRYEIIDGTLYVSPFPTSAHQYAATRLTALLSNHVHAAMRGVVFAANLKVVLDQPTGVGPDIVYISQARLDGLKADGYYGAPDLLVEVLSSRPSLDTQIKKDKYERSGVPHYWIVDSERRLITIYRLEDDRYRCVAEYRNDDTLEHELFPGLSIPLDDLWLF
jgi:Uma2 family endonuclease